MNFEDDSFLDEIGVWSEVKLEIIKKYASAYSTIMTKQKRFNHFYIDAFSGAGFHKSKTRQEIIEGSPIRAINVTPSFKHFYFIDLNNKKTDMLQRVLGSRDDVTLLEGDCNKVLIEDVYPKISYKNYDKALCLLDPYGLHLDWNVIKEAGRMKCFDIFLNFPVMDMNMNALWSNPEKVDPKQAGRLTRYWGDESWKKAVYDDLNLFKFREKVADSNNKIVEAFRIRLKKEAGFKYVPKPMVMKNTTGAIVYYLFFASQNNTGSKIVVDIFNNYSDKV